MLKEFWFNTGVRIWEHTPPVPLCGEYQIAPNGIKQILFYCEDVPDGAMFLFTCDNPDLPEGKGTKRIVKEIVKGGLCSKYAYFSIP